LPQENLPAHDEVLVGIGVHIAIRSYYRPSALQHIMLSIYLQESWKDLQAYIWPNCWDPFPTQGWPANLVWGRQDESPTSCIPGGTPGVQ